MIHAVLTLEKHYRFTSKLVDSAEDLLAEARENGSLNDWNKALEMCLKIQDFSGKELIRYRVRKQLLECTGVVTGEYDGRDDVELGSWADGIDASEVPAEAQRLIDMHRGIFQ